MNKYVMPTAVSDGKAAEALRYLAELASAIQQGTVTFDWQRDLADADLLQIYQLACEALEQGDLETARSHFGLLLLLKPQECRFYISLGLTLQLMDETQEALGYYLAALTTRKNDPFLLFRIAQCFLKLGLSEQAHLALNWIVECMAPNDGAVPNHTPALLDYVQRLLRAVRAA